MIKITVALAFLIALIILPLRFAVSNSSFFGGGFLEGIQACKVDSDCKWVDTGCCGCQQGGNEIVINKTQETTYKLLYKPLCLKEPNCSNKNACHAEEVFCDGICKFGKRVKKKPLLSR